MRLGRQNIERDVRRLRPFLTSAIQTLVDVNVMATTGGRILVGNTTSLDADISATDTTILTRHNSLQADDIVILEARGAIEFMQIAAGPEGDGPYTYTVTRDLAGLGASPWYANDAVFDSGQIGTGFIDLYANNSLNGDETGPTMAINVRDTADYDGWRTRTAVGNLLGLYGYDEAIYGAAFGRFGPTDVWVATEEKHGFRIMRGDTCIGQWAPNQTLTLGPEGGPQWRMDPRKGLQEWLHGGKVLRALDGESGYLYGWEGMGRPHGPAIRWGTENKGKVSERYVWRIIDGDGVPIISMMSGTKAKPDDVQMIIGREGAVNRLTYIAGVLTLIGSIVASSGQVGGFAISETALASANGLAQVVSQAPTTENPWGEGLHLFMDTFAATGNGAVTWQNQDDNSLRVVETASGSGAAKNTVRWHLIYPGSTGYAQDSLLVYEDPFGSEDGYIRRTITTSPPTVGADPSWKLERHDGSSTTTMIEILPDKVRSPEAEHVAWITAADLSPVTGNGDAARIKTDGSCVQALNQNYPFYFRFPIPRELFGAEIDVTSIKVYYETLINGAYVDRVRVIASDMDGTTTDAVDYTSDLGNGSIGAGNQELLSADYRVTDAPHVIEVTPAGVITNGDVRIYGIRVTWHQV